MKTNQLMKVAFSHGEVEVFHKTAMGSLTQLWNCGNTIRGLNGKSPANLSRFLKSSSTVEFISIAEKESGCKAFEVTGRGNTKRTWASMHLMIYAAEYLSAQFHYEVIDTFIKGKLLDYRDESGDNFKAMNVAIDNNLPGRAGKDNKGLRIQIAKKIKHKVNPEIVSWNFASSEDLRYRSDLEDKITMLLSMGLVDSYDHLKELIDKL